MNKFKKAEALEGLLLDLDCDLGQLSFLEDAIRSTLKDVLDEVNKLKFMLEEEEEENEESA